MTNQEKNTPSPVQTINEQSQEATIERIKEFFKYVSPEEFAQQLNRATHIMTALAFKDPEYVTAFSDWLDGCFYHINDFSEILKPNLTNKNV